MKFAKKCLKSLHCSHIEFLVNKKEVMIDF